MAIHELKVWPEHFEELRAGRKTFEARKDDRGYAVGDTLVLREWNPAVCDCISRRLCRARGCRGSYTGRIEVRRVLHLMRGPAHGVEAGYVVMSLEITEQQREVDT